MVYQPSGCTCLHKEKHEFRDDRVSAFREKQGRGEKREGKESGIAFQSLTIQFPPFCLPSSSSILQLMPQFIALGQFDRQTGEYVLLS
ncbi:hypothetical protein GUJ93_ZPchr0008g12643 [Zizania palustris]|uniref:Uncharacterized protein n=1 Tax=Zizania palustris TaxID=103762 RepID=A0A8J5V0M7_ZIZPA|nr:hypothetical protein GUJ93_ZPchr0008g12643 [Zizania palustris]